MVSKYNYAVVYNGYLSFVQDNSKTGMNHEKFRQLVRDTWVKKSTEDAFTAAQEAAKAATAAAAAAFSAPVGGSTAMVICP